MATPTTTTVSKGAKKNDRKKKKEEKKKKAKQKKIAMRFTRFGVYGSDTRARLDRRPPPEHGRRRRRIHLSPDRRNWRKPLPKKNPKKKRKGASGGGEQFSLGCRVHPPKKNNKNKRKTMEAHRSSLKREREREQ